MDGTFNTDAELVWFMPHMHVRGKDMTYTLTYPTGESEIVLNVPKYDFDWQPYYYLETPKQLPRGFFAESAPRALEGDRIPLFFGAHWPAPCQRCDWGSGRPSRSRTRSTL